MMNYKINAPSNTSNTLSTATAPATITYSDDGFSPSTITVKAGGVEPGQTKAFTVAKTGIFSIAIILILSKQVKSSFRSNQYTRSS